jgi:hypothetical protein
MIKTINEEMEEKPQRRGSKKIVNKGRLNKSFAYRKSFKRKRGSVNRNKGIKSTYRSIFRAKRSRQGTKNNFTTAQKEAKRRMKNKKSNANMDMDRRKTIMWHSTNNLQNELKNSIHRQRTHDPQSSTDQLFSPIEKKKPSFRYKESSNWLDPLDEIKKDVENASKKIQNYALINPIIQRHERTSSFLHKLPIELKNSLFNNLSNNDSDASKSNYLSLGDINSRNEITQHPNIRLSSNSKVNSLESNKTIESTKTNNLEEGKLEGKLEENGKLAGLILGIEQSEFSRHIIQLKPVTEWTDGEDVENQSQIDLLKCSESPVKRKTKLKEDIDTLKKISESNFII